MIRCDDKAPSVPDVILQVISEILSENHQAAIVAQAQPQPSPKSPKSPVVSIIPSSSSPRPNPISPINSSLKSINLNNNNSSNTGPNQQSSSSASSSQQNSPAQIPVKSNIVNNLIPDVVLNNKNSLEVSSKLLRFLALFKARNNSKSIILRLIIPYFALEN